MPLATISCRPPLRPRRSRRYTLPIALLSAASITALLPTDSLGQQGPANVVVSNVIRADVAASQSVVGTVRPYREVVVGSAVDGRVLEVPVRSGQKVASREPLAHIRTATIEIEIEGAKAELDLRLAELEELRNGSRPEELRLAEAAVEAATAMQDYALAKFSRAERLSRNGAGISQDEFEEARAQSRQAAATLAEAISQLELVREGPRPERIKQAAAKVAVQQQVIAGLEDRLAKYTVRSPFEGYVVEDGRDGNGNGNSADRIKIIEAGAWLRQGEPVAKIVDIAHVELEVHVLEDYVGFVRRGLKCFVRVQAYPEQTFQGEVVQIVPLGNTLARTFPVKVRIENPLDEEGQHVLLPGMSAQVPLPTSNTRSELLVHKDALQLAGGKAAVMKVVDGKAVSVPVLPGIAFDGLIAIEPLAPLDAGDTIVVRGNERLRAGQAVAISSRLDVESPTKSSSE